MDLMTDVLSAIEERDNNIYRIYFKRRFFITIVSLPSEIPEMSTAETLSGQSRLKYSVHKKNTCVQTRGSKA